MQVGVLVAIAAVLRAKPLVAFQLSDKILAAGQQYASQQRMPFLLWVLAQASRCGLARPQPYIIVCACQAR